MNAIFISFTDSHFHFVKSFWHSLKANYPYHPILLVNYIGNSQEVKDFFRQCNSAELIQVENSYSYSTAHNYPEALFYLGDLCIRLDRIDEARKWLLTLLETAPDESEFIPLADQLLNRIKGH